MHCVSDIGSFLLEIGEELSVELMADRNGRLIVEWPMNPNTCICNSKRQFGTKRSMLAILGDVAWRQRLERQEDQTLRPLR